MYGHPVSSMNQYVLLSMDLSASCSLTQVKILTSIRQVSILCQTLTLSRMMNSFYYFKLFFLLIFWFVIGNSNFFYLKVEKYYNFCNNLWSISVPFERSAEFDSDIAIWNFWLLCLLEFSEETWSWYVHSPYWPVGVDIFWMLIHTVTHKYIQSIKHISH
jgi:hypothetical protein